MDRNLTPSDFWAKLETDDDGNVVDWHPLLAHSADVAAVTEALLQRTILRDRLASLIGWDDLGPVHIGRLSVLAALHDAGKVNHGFQNREFGMRRTCRSSPGASRFGLATTRFSMIDWDLLRNQRRSGRSSGPK